MNELPKFSARQAGIPAQPPAPRTGRKIFIRDLEIQAFIGVYESEMGRRQPIIINVEVMANDPEDLVSDDVQDVICYNKLTKAIEEILGETHIKLVETVAERIADYCLQHPLAQSVRVTVDKPEAIPNAAGAGVEITRTK